MASVKILRYNNNLLMNKALIKAVMTRSRLTKIALQKNGTAKKSKEISA